MFHHFFTNNYVYIVFVFFFIKYIILYIKQGKLFEFIFIFERSPCL